MKPDKLLKATPHSRPEIWPTELRIKSPTGARKVKLEKLLSLLTKEKTLDEIIL
jgi:hypothetical protein